MADIPGDTTTTATLSVGGSLSSAIDFVGDHDWIAINLVAGQAVDISVALGTLEDSYLSIRDSSGNILFSNDDIVDGVNRASEVKFDPTYTGKYYIDVSAWPDPNQGQAGDTYTGVGTYTVSAQPYTPPPVATNDQIANQLTSGAWGGDVHHWAVTQGGTLTVDIHTLTAAEQTFARTALSEWTDIIGVHFQEVTSGAQITFSDAKDTDGTTAVAQTDASWSNGIITSANVQISSNWDSWTSLDSYGLQTYIHEIGHALGLGHEGNYNDGDSGNSPITYPYSASFANDAWSTSVMSYFSQHDNTYFGNQGFSELYVLTPMVADIVAMQSLYGLSTTTRTGDTVYGDHSNAGGIYDASLYPHAAFTILDSGGNDTIDYSLSSANQLINLNPETFSNVNGYTGNLEIARGTVIENAIGGSGNDTIIGNSANNVLTGNAGADTLTGGGGNDTFLDSESGHNGDTITDFHPGDAIVFSDAIVSGFSFSLSGNTLTYSGGSMTVDGTVSGKFTAISTASGAVELSEARGHTAHNDFNGDGTSDVLWQDSNGTLTDWLGNKTSGAFTDNSSHAVTAGPGAGWVVAGTGDFNGDSSVDILFRNTTTGALTDWLGTGNGSFTDNSAHALNGSADNSWQIAGVGDFNGDGISDILWRNTGGYLTEWLGTANGSFVSNQANAGTSIADNSWHVVGTGDFNGDGISDILWRNTGGYLTEWLGTANGSFVSNQANAGTSIADNSWQVVGTGDFNGDGISDILWRNTGGYVTEWLGTANGSFVSNQANAGTSIADNSWHVVSIGDFNGDSIDDILWQNSSGYVTEWLGTTTGAFTDNSAHAASGAVVGTTWHVQDPLV